MVMDSPTDASLPALSAACMMKLDEPSAVGVPKMTPVDELRVKPGGNDPARK
jgi:hypothetical protein